MAYSLESAFRVPAATLSEKCWPDFSRLCGGSDRRNSRSDLTKLDQSTRFLAASRMGRFLFPRHGRDHVGQIANCPKNGTLSGVTSGRDSYNDSSTRARYLF